MNKKELVDHFRKRRGKFNAGDITISMGTTQLHGGGILELVDDSFKVTVTFKSGTVTLGIPEGIRTIDQFWDVNGTIEHDFPFVNAEQVKGFAFELVVGSDLGATQASKVLKYDKKQVEIDLVIDGFFCQCKNLNGVLDLTDEIKGWVKRAMYFKQPIRFYVSQTTQVTQELEIWLGKRNIKVIKYPPL